MKVLWFSNCMICNTIAVTSGTWLFSMARSLAGHDIALYNITQTTNKKIEKVQDKYVVEYRIPSYKLFNGLPTEDNIKKILNVVEEINPDIIHIWGLELYFGLLASRKYLKGRVLLEIQGIKGECVPVFYGGLTPSELFKTIGLRELIKPSISLIGKRLCYEKWSKYEKEMVSQVSHISTQSEWVRNWVKMFAPNNAHIHKTMISVRQPFCESKKWCSLCRKTKQLLVIAAGSEAYKGVHIAIKALPLIKRYFPDIQLKIIGYFANDKPSYRKPGYTKFLLDLIKKLNLEDNVIFLGQKQEQEIIEEMLNTDCFLQTSFVESYSLALAEAMIIGVPCVISYAGAMPELARNNESALFYPTMDYVSLASKVCSLLGAPALCKKLSEESIQVASQRNAPDIVGAKQVEIYEDIMKISNND